MTYFKQGQNFIVLFSHKNRLIEWWQWQLIGFMFFKYLEKLKTTPQLISKKMKPLYMTFKKTWANQIGNYFRLILVTLPTFTLVQLIINFEMTWKWWIPTIILAPFILINIINFIADVIYKSRVKAHNLSITTDKYVITRFGMPGGGKTSSLMYDMKILADLMWAEIKREYKLLKPYLDEIKFWPKQARENAEEIIEAYNFYKESKCYPCLWTSVPAFVDGVPANRVTADHLMQRKKLPYGAVVVLDEVSLILPQELFRDKPIEIKELCKFPRHFGDFHISTTEQGKDNMLIDLRRSSAENKCMVQQKWVLKARFLSWLYNFTLDHTKKTTKAKTTFFRIFKSIINSIGYRKYTYYDAGTEDRETKGKYKSFILPPYLNISYDNRAFKNAYRCKDEKFEFSSWEHMRLSKEELDEIFTKELQERAKTKQQKKSKKTQNVA